MITRNQPTVVGMNPTMAVLCSNGRCVKHDLNPTMAVLCSDADVLSKIDSDLAAFGNGYRSGFEEVL